MMRLGVNVDHVATVRQARGIDQPDPVEAALLAEKAGADQITVHLREDRRHIQDRDVRVLREVLRTRLNLEMAATAEMVGIAMEIRPDIVTFVPERREELTTEGGLDIGHMKSTGVLSRYIRQLKEAGIAISLFIDPDIEAVKGAHSVEADAIELHTGRYCDAVGKELRKAELERIRNASRVGAKLGLAVHAGHGLNLENVSPIAAIEEIEELNIGHSLIGRAIMEGMEEAVSRMKRRMNEARSSRPAGKGWFGG